MVFFLPYLLPAAILPVILVLAFKLFHWERGLKVTCALGAIAVILCSLVWFHWPVPPFSGFALSPELLAWWTAVSIYPLFVYLIVLAVGKRLILDTDKDPDPED